MTVKDFSHNIQLVTHRKWLKLVTGLFLIRSWQVGSGFGEDLARESVRNRQFGVDVRRIRQIVACRRVASTASSSSQHSGQTEHENVGWKSSQTTSGTIDSYDVLIYTATNRMMHARNVSHFGQLRKWRHVFREAGALLTLTMSTRKGDRDT